KARETFNLGHIILLIMGIILLIMLPANENKGSIIEMFTMGTYIYLFISGCLASAAMILPGISGSLVFLMLVVYPTIINALDELNLLIMAVVGLGIFFGIISMSKVIQFFLLRFRTATFAIIIGLVIGSIFVIFPGWPIQIKSGILSIATFSFGLL